MTENQMAAELRTHLYTCMVRIRKFEEKIVALCQESDRMPGMQILANGQEAVATGIVSALEPEDVIVSNHRSHGHLLARNADMKALMAEIMAKATGVNGGKAGAQPLEVHCATRHIFQRAGGYDMPGQACRRTQNPRARSPLS